MKQSKLEERKKKLLRKSCPRVCYYLVACDHPFISFTLWTLCRLVYKLLCSRMNGWMDKWMDEWMDEWMNKRTRRWWVKSLTRGEFNLLEFESLTVHNSTQSYPASSGYIFAVWAAVWKVASADNHSNGFFPVLDRFRALRESCVSLA